MNNNNNDNIDVVSVLKEATNNLFAWVDEHYVDNPTKKLYKDDVWMIESQTWVDFEIENTNTNLMLKLVNMRDLANNGATHSNSTVNHSKSTLDQIAYELEIVAQKIREQIQ